MSIIGNQVGILNQPARKGDIRSSVGNPLFSQLMLDVKSPVQLGVGLRKLVNHIVCENQRVA